MSTPSSLVRHSNPFQSGNRAEHVVLAIHGGAGAAQRELMPALQQTAIYSALDEALQRGWEALQATGSSLEAVTHAVVAMEDCPLFNAGRGAVFSHEGRIELDASIMEGFSRKAGAVAGVTRIKNPIRLARAVMEQSEHVFLMGSGAEQFARTHGISFAPMPYFASQHRWEQLREALEADKLLLDEVEVARTSQRPPPDPSRRYGTVGAVARTATGTLAAATSTGGMTNKRFGRVGDSPVIGAGVYAWDRTCAVSSTGHGEYFLRGVCAYDISALVEFLGLDIYSAAERVISERLRELGGAGGVIALDPTGHLAMPFNTAGMYRGYVLEDGSRHSFVWDSPLSPDERT